MYVLSSLHVYIVRVRVTGCGHGGVLLSSYILQHYTCIYCMPLSGTGQLLKYIILGLLLVL